MYVQIHDNIHVCVYKIEIHVSNMSYILCPDIVICERVSAGFYSNLRSHAHTQLYTILIRTDIQDIQTQLYINRFRADQLHVMQSCKHNSRRPETQL